MSFQHLQLLDRLDKSSMVSVHLVNAIETCELFRVEVKKLEIREDEAGNCAA